MSTTLEGFIRDHRAELVAWVRRACPKAGRLSDRDLLLWVLNDDRIYKSLRCERPRSERMRVEDWARRPSP